jgi:hypothetical protein
MNTHEILIQKLEDIAKTENKTNLLPIIKSLRATNENATRQEVLVIYREIREADVFPESTTFFLILHRLEREIDPIVEREVEDADREYRDRKEELRSLIEKTIQNFLSQNPIPSNYVRELFEDLIDDGFETKDNAPNLSDIREQAEKRIFPEELRFFGEHKMAELFEEDQRKFERMREQGRQFFYGPETDPGMVEYMKSKGIID